MIEGRTAETCNVYNMIKMTRALFALDPQMRYADFHERALFNHILGSMDPADGATCYMVPVGQGVVREYQDMEEDFTCCVGSGMESHALHGDGLYYESGDTLWVNLYAPSTADWSAAGVRLTDDDVLPRGRGGRADDRDEEAAPLHDRAPPSVLGGRRLLGQGQRRGREGPGPGRDPMSASAGSGRRGTRWTWSCPRPFGWSPFPAIRTGRRSCGAPSSWPATSAPSRRDSPATRPSPRPRRRRNGRRRPSS